MSDRIKKIKIKQSDGTFSDYIPIGADAKNIDTTRGESVQSAIDKTARYYNSIAEMKLDDNIQIGDTCITLGYYEVNDGGGATYKIIDASSLEDDGGSIHELNNGLKAELVIKDNKVMPEQFGAYGDGEHDDTIAFQNMFKFYGYDYFLNSKRYKITEPLVIPAHCSLIGSACSRILDVYPVRKSILDFKGSNLSNVTLITGDTVSCDNICLMSDSFEVTENRKNQTIETKTDWFTTTINNENVNGFSCYCTNCTAIGISGNAFVANYGKLLNCTAEKCNIGFCFKADSQGEFLRSFYVNNCIVAKYNNNITNVRADSVYKSFIIIEGSGNIISNLTADYVGEYLFEINNGGNSISGIYGDRFGINHVQYSLEEYESLEYLGYTPTWYMILVDQLSAGYSTSITNIGKTGGRSQSENQLVGINGLIRYRGGRGARNVSAINFDLIPKNFFDKRNFGTSSSFYTDVSPFNIDDFKHIVSCDSSDVYSIKNRCPMTFTTEFGIVNALKMTLEFPEEKLIVTY